MINRISLFIILLILSSYSKAYNSCSKGNFNCINTTMGKLEFISGKDSHDKNSRIYLENKVIFKGDIYQIGPDPKGLAIDHNNNVKK